jgi:hypothetical protein
MAWCSASSEMCVEYLRTVDIGARHKSIARNLLARDIKVVRASYWRATQKCVQVIGATKK